MFDLTAHPENIQPAYGFYGVFVIAGVILAILAAAAHRWRWRRRYFHYVFATVWIGLCTALIFLDIRDVLHIRELVRRGEYATVEGCLDSFRPGRPDAGRTTAGNERWSVRGVRFDYGDGDVRPGYAVIEPRGGLVHANARVRVSYVASPYHGRNEIMRLEIVDRSCPPAGYGDSSLHLRDAREFRG